MSPVPNDNPITPLIRRSSKSSSSIIELNSDVENTTSLLDDYCRSAILHQGCPTTHFHIYPTTPDSPTPPPPPRPCRAPDYPTATNLHQGCRATDYPTTTNLHQGCRATDVHVYPTTTNLHDGYRATDSGCGKSR